MICGADIAAAIERAIQESPGRWPDYRDVPECEGRFPVSMRQLVEGEWPWEPNAKAAGERRLYERGNAPWAQRLDDFDGAVTAQRNREPVPIRPADFPTRPRGPVKHVRQDFSRFAPLAKAIYAWAQEYRPEELRWIELQGGRYGRKWGLLDYRLDVSVEWPLFKLLRWKIRDAGHQWDDVFPWERADLGQRAGWQVLWNKAVLPLVDAQSGGAMVPLVELLEACRLKLALGADQPVRLPAGTMAFTSTVVAGGGVMMKQKMSLVPNDHIELAEKTFNKLLELRRWDLLGARWGRAIESAAAFRFGPVIRRHELDAEVLIDGGRAIAELLVALAAVTKLAKDLRALTRELTVADRHPIAREREAAEPHFWSWLVSRLLKIARKKNIQPRRGPELIRVFAEEKPNHAAG